MKITRVIQKIFLVTIISFSLVICLCNFSYADGSTKMPSWDDLKGQADGFVSQGEAEGGQIMDSDTMHGIVAPIAQMLVSIAIIVLIVVTIIMGIKYMLTDAEGKGKLKVQLIGLVVAIIVIFGAQFIWATLYEFLTDVTG